MARTMQECGCRTPFASAEVAPQLTAPARGAPDVGLSVRSRSAFRRKRKAPAAPMTALRCSSNKQTPRLRVKRAGGIPVAPPVAAPGSLLA